MYSFTVFVKFWATALRIAEGCVVVFRATRQIMFLLCHRWSVFSGARVTFADFRSKVIPPMYLVIKI